MSLLQSSLFLLLYVGVVYCFFTQMCRQMYVKMMSFAMVLYAVATSSSLHIIAASEPLHPQNLHFKTIRYEEKIFIQDFF